MNAPDNHRADIAAIHGLIARWKNAFRVKDLDEIASCYAPGDAVVAFDLVPPLAIRGREGYMRNYEGFLAMYEGPIDVEVRDLALTVGNGVAFLSCLDRFAGTLQGGVRHEVWVRVTSGLRKLDGAWVIVHDHVSVPVDFASAKAALDLSPD